MKPKSVVLLVEDEPDLREALGEFLEACGFAILAAGTAEGALDLAKKHSPDAVLTDLSLPDLKGLEFLEILHKEQPDCLLFVHSGDSSFVAPPKMMAYGLSQDHVFYKPADLSQMAEKIQDFLKARS